ncbi:MAG: hypothetical protein LPK00_01360 [Bacillaceae bacterium]|nr:hypothetical protein [Bacillaceae bacterium]
MWRFIVVSVLILSILTGCLYKSEQILDVSKLERKSPLEMEPVSYLAPNVKVALEAIPFKLTLPTNLPFESEGFRDMDIVDWFEEDGKNISIELLAIPQKASGETSYVAIHAQDFQVELTTDGDELLLQNGTKAIFNGGSDNKAGIFFIHDRVLI